VSALRACRQTSLLVAVLLAAAVTVTSPIVARADTVAGSDTAASADTEARLGRYVEEIAARQDPRVAGALAGIDGTGRRLLALRSYLRSSDRLAERWSWTQEQIAAYERSPEYREMQQDIERVREAFTRENPGFGLWVNPQVRSLDVQIASWNTNESVAAAAANLSAAVLELVNGPTFPATRQNRARKAVETFLIGYRPDPKPTVAAPGLSPHGQMRAVDFQVQDEERIVAGPETATLATDWDAAGWSARLETAVRAASSRFIGPLASPREPWHYTYSPEAIAAQ
jgi:hypothetical protein